MGSKKKSAGTVWGVSSPDIAYYRMLPTKSTEMAERSWETIAASRLLMVTPFMKCSPVRAPSFDSPIAGRTSNGNSMKPASTTRRRAPKCFALGFTHRTIAKALRVAVGTVSEYLAKAKKGGLSWPLPEELSDGELEAGLFPPPGSSGARPGLDYAPSGQNTRTPSGSAVCTFPKAA